MRSRRRLGWLAAAAALAGLLVAAVWALNRLHEAPIDDAGSSAGRSGPPAAAPELVARGAYLARAGNCAGCHTAQGGVPYAGGRGVVTPFGTVFAPNLTPDAATGIGAWTDDEFWRAMHNGRSRDGRLLYPVFPYPNYTRITRADADAVHAYLRSLPPTVQTNRRHDLRFPFDRAAALAVWRALYFRPGEQVADPNRPAAWNRGAYLVEGLGHCSACHASRNRLGASVGPLALGGGLIPVQNWYAPSLASSAQAGVADWAPERIVRLLKTGVVDGASVLGPMAEVVSGSTQHLSDADLNAVAVFLRALPADAAVAAPPPVPSGPQAAEAASLDRGAALYTTHCAQCHGDGGEGAPGAYPPLAGNRAVTLDPPANLIHVVLEGGFAPTTAGNPRPYGMPPFSTVLSNADLADVLSHVRGAWGNRAAPVTPLDVDRYRSDR